MGYPHEVTFKVKLAIIQTRVFTSISFAGSFNARVGVERVLQVRRMRDRCPIHISLYRPPLTRFPANSLYGLYGQAAIAFVAKEGKPQDFGYTQYSR